MELTIQVSIENKKAGDQVRKGWEKQVQDKIKSFIENIASKCSQNWAMRPIVSEQEYLLAGIYLKKP